MRLKNVWILNHYAQEPGGPGGTRHFSLACYLRQHGWCASIIAASTELNTNRQRLRPEEECRLECFNEVSFLWLKTPPYVGNGSARIKNMLVYTYRALQQKYLTALPKPQVIIGSSVHPLAAWSGAYLATRYKVPFLFEVRDLWPQTLIDLGRIPENGMQDKLLKVLEKWLYKRADKIITLLPYAIDYICPLGISNDKIFYLPNGVDLSDFAVSPVKKNGHPFTFLYFGAHGTANGLDNLLQAMALLENDSAAPLAKLRLIGDGPLKHSLESLAKELKLNHVYFESPVAKTKIPEVAAEADAYIFNLVDAPVFKYGISSNKLFDFLAGGRPIIFCCDAANNPVAEAGAGLSVPPGNPRALANAMISLMKMTFEEKALLGHNARSYVEKNHDYLALAKRLANLLDNVVEK